MNSEAQLSARLEGLLRDLEHWPDQEMRERAAGMLGTVLEFHACALQRLVRSIERAGTPGTPILESWARDDMVAGMLLLHGLHPHDLPTRVRRALDAMRPRLNAQGAEATLTSPVESGTIVVEVRLSAGTPSSGRPTAIEAIRRAIEAAAPDAEAVHIEDRSPPPTTPSGFVAVTSITHNSRPLRGAPAVEGCPSHRP